MTDLSKIAPLQPYTGKQIASFKLSAADFDQLDAQVADSGTQVVVFHKATGQNLSTALTIDEGDQLYCEVSRALPVEKCGKHRPYSRTRRNGYDGFSPCRCAAVFLNHLLVSLAAARANKANQRLAASVR